jgi:hypothetical protein
MCEEVTDQMGYPIHPGARIVTDYWEEHHFQWCRSGARKEKVVAPAVEDAILRLAQVS